MRIPLSRSYRSLQRLDARAILARIDPYHWMNFVLLTAFLVLLVLTLAAPARTGG